MKKFYTVIPLQVKGQLIPQKYTACDNQKLAFEKETAFPIIAAIAGYVERGEAFRLIAIVTDVESCWYNLSLLESELKELAQDRGFVCPKIETVQIAEDDSVSAHVALFQKLIDLADDDDDLFACMTFGTKPTSQALLMALQYAHRIKRNTIINCVVYGQIQRRGREVVGANLYDMTALIQMDDIVRLLAEQGVQDPKKVIDAILTL